KAMAGGSEIVTGKRFDTSPQITLQTESSAATSLIIDGNSVTGPTPLLADGGHTLVATARDTAGNQARLELTFFVGAGGATTTGCGLANFDPPNNAAIFANQVKLTGSTGGAANVLVNGTRANIADGGFTASVALTSEGANAITIQCAGANGAAT